MPTLPEPFVKGQGNFAARLNQLRSYVAALLTEEQSNDAYAALVNTDDDPGRTIYVGSTDPEVGHTPIAGDVWLEITA